MHNVNKTQTLIGVGLIKTIHSYSHKKIKNNQKNLKNTNLVQLDKKSIFNAVFNFG